MVMRGRAVGKVRLLLFFVIIRMMLVYLFIWYLFAGIIRVDVTCDNGKTWHTAKLQQEPSQDMVCCLIKYFIFHFIIL
jgi:hypothetical protein